MKGLFFIMIGLSFLLAQQCRVSDSSPSKYWLHADYLDCLQDRLPCECQTLLGSYYSLQINSSSGVYPHQIQLLRASQLEPDIFPLSKAKTRQYQLHKSLRDSTNWATLRLDKDKLLLEITKGETNSFVPTDARKIPQAQRHMLDNALTSRGHRTVSSLTGLDSLGCQCNWWMGGLNLLSRQGQPDAWVLEQSNDSLLIKQILNPMRDPDDSLQLKIIHQLKF